MLTLPRPLFVLTLAIACQPMPPSGDTGAPAGQQSGVTIHLDRTSYSAGSQLQLRLTNHTANQLGYNPCTRSVERRAGESWSLIVERDRVCTMQLYLLDAHATRTDPTDLPSSLAPGTYRIVLSFSNESSGAPQTPIRAVSAPFQVQ